MEDLKNVKVLISEEKIQERIDEFYSMAENFKAQTNAKYLTVLTLRFC